MSKIVFLQPNYAHYREKLFSILAKEFDMQFLFMGYKNTYPGKINIGNIPYEIIEHLYRNKRLGLIAFLLKNNPDIIITSVSTSFRTVIAFLYVFLFRKKLILWIEEWRKNNYQQKNLLKYFIGIIRNFVGTHVILRSDALVVGGTATKEYAISLGKHEDEIFMSIQCSDDITEGQGLGINSSIKDSKYTFLYFSRIIEWKGLDILIKAFELLRRERNDISLLIAGDGPFAPFCRKLCESLNIKDVIFQGPVFPENRKSYFEQADVFVLPCKFIDNFYEAWGLVINEALSMKLPVVTTDAVGAAFDLVFNGHNGFVVRDNSVSDLYRAMKKILCCDLFIMGQNSRKIFNNKNDFKKMVQGFSQAIVFVKNK